MKAILEGNQNIEGTPSELAQFFKEYAKNTPLNAPKSDLKADVSEDKDYTETGKKKLKPRQWQRWSVEEEQFLKDNHHRKNTVIAKELKRTTNAVAQRKGVLGLNDQFDFE